MFLFYLNTGSDVSYSRSVAQMSIDCISKHWTWNDQLCMKCSNLSNYPNSQWDRLLDINQCLTSLRLSVAVNENRGVFIQTPTWEPGAPAECIRQLNTNTSNMFVIISIQLFTLHQITSPSAPLNTPVWNDNVETINTLLQFSRSQQYSGKGHLWDNGPHFSFEFHALNHFMQITVNHTASSSAGAATCYK